MEKRLQKIGNSRGIILPAAVLDHIGTNDTVVLTMESDGRVVLTAPVSAGRKQSFKEALAETNDQYGPALKRLSEDPSV